MRMRRDVAICGKSRKEKMKKKMNLPGSLPSLPNHPYVNKPILSGINERSLRAKWDTLPWIAYSSCRGETSLKKYYFTKVISKS